MAGASSSAYRAMRWPCSAVCGSPWLTSTNCSRDGSLAIISRTNRQTPPPQPCTMCSTTGLPLQPGRRSEEHTSELQSLMRISYAVFCLKKKIHTHTHHVHKAH